VADELRRRLLAGEYQPGSPLRDTTLAAEFDAARPTVRAAVQHLVANGLLQRGRGRSATVPVFTTEDAVDLYRVRESLELAAVRLVVERACSLTPMEQAVIALRNLPKQTSRHGIADAEIEFHSALFVSAGSPRLARAFDTVADELRLLVAQLHPLSRDSEEVTSEHAELLLHLRAGRIRPAVAAWRAHLDEAQQVVLRALADRRPARSQPGSANPSGANPASTDSTHANPGHSQPRRPPLTDPADAATPRSRR
jgi:DNA-binding GntR family transcriptional regulator